MSYTVGIKRRFFPGYRKVQVTAHDWNNFRFILNLTDGSQEIIPGFSSRGVKVYADFWTHLHMQQAKVVPRETPREPPAPVHVEPDETPPPGPPPVVQEDDAITREVKRRAAERVRALQSSEFQA
jgi:hypothetical protein